MFGNIVAKLPRIHRPRQILKLLFFIPFLFPSCRYSISSSVCSTKSDSQFILSSLVPAILIEKFVPENSQCILGEKFVHELLLQ